MELVKGLSIIVLLAVAGIGWVGYYTEYKMRNKYEKKVNKLYGIDLER